MEEQHLEQLLEYQHASYEKLNYTDPDSFQISTEDVIQLNSSRIIYLWDVNISGDHVNVFVLGVLERERYRKDFNGRVYSRVRPVSDELKPNLEVAIWAEFIKKPEAIQLRITRFDNFRFDYC